MHQAGLLFCYLLISSLVILSHTRRELFVAPERESMIRNWLCLSLRILPVVFAVLAVSHPALAHFSRPEGDDAPELDPRLVMEGLAVAGVAGALIWERVRRRR
jgi:hypothetical protein